MVDGQCVNNLMGLSSQLLTLNYNVLHENLQKESDISFSHHYLDSGNEQLYFFIFRIYLVINVWMLVI